MFLLSISDKNHDACIQVSNLNVLNGCYRFVVQIPYFTFFQGISFEFVMVMSKEHVLDIYEMGKLKKHRYEVKVVYICNF